MTGADAPAPRSRPPAPGAWARPHAAWLLALACAGCPDGNRPPPRHYTQVRPARVDPPPPSPPRHPAHEHPHGPHPHSRSDHHHHPHPHPHLAGLNHHHHPY
ncbi:MAG TPA: hypothetical protein VFK02_16855 [Kofleriaceae bacterium]|nr:hypothetical protein [Kofleriaceae bacterium]